MVFSRSAIAGEADGAVASTGISSLENISQELVKVRQEIGALHTDINFEKERYRDQLRSYSSQKSDLDVRISRAELNLKDLQRELKKLAEQNMEKSQAQADVTPVLKQAIKTLRSSVSNSLPFKLKDRLKVIDEIEFRLDSNTISPNKAANQLWAFVEDELMLGKSNGIYNDIVVIGGQEKLVKVLRIGKIAMFYKTSDDVFGVTKLDQGKWQQTVLDDSDSVSQLEVLFDSFNKNIRNGQFVTPNFLPRS
jgi:aspartyl-tRNA synthetase